MTAAERAAEVILTLDEASWAAHAAAADAEDIVAALMADPALLVDCAIEAGGLERAGLLIDGAEFIPVELVPDSFAVPPGVNVEALYRRTTQENGQP